MALTPWQQEFINTWSHGSTKKHPSFEVDLPVAHSRSTSSFKQLAFDFRPKPIEYADTAFEITQDANISDMPGSFFGNKAPKIAATVEKRGWKIPALSRNMKIGLGLGGLVAAKMFFGRKKEYKDYSNVSLFGNGFSGRDDTYNTIEGLKHGGQAQKKRREMTPFGSGWDPLRNLVADHLGAGQKAFKGFTESKGFQQALTKGKIVKTLGQGAFGEAHLMETSISLGGKEHAFQYVRKTPLRTKPEKVFAEARAMDKMSDLNAPNVYGINKEHQTYMEHFKGEMAHDIMLRGDALPETFVNDLDQFFQASKSRDIAHIDAIRDVTSYHGKLVEKGLYADEYVPHNIIMTPEGRAGVIDFGQAVPASTKPKYKEKFLGLFGQDATKEEYRTHLAMSGYIGKKLPTAGDLDAELVAGLRRQKGKISPEYQVRERTVSDTGKSSASAAATNKGGKIRSSDPMRKEVMAVNQKRASAAMFTNAKSGGRRSKSAYTSGRKTI